MKLSAFKGAALGLSAWVVYGTLETTLSIGAQLYHHPQMNMAPWQWKLIADLMGMYAAVGLALGAVAGAILGWRGRDDIYARQLAATLGLPLAFGANLIAGRQLSAPEYAALLIAVALGAAFTTGVFAGEWGKRIVFLASPWATSLLLLGVPWANWDALGGRRSWPVRTVATALLLASVAIMAKFVRRLRRNAIPGAARQAAAGWVGFGIFFILAWIRSAPASIRQAPAAAPERGKPNVVLITMDTVRADHLPMYGYDHGATPNLGKLVASATLYTRATATSDYTLATHASIFTGLYPAWHGALMLPAPKAHHQPLRPEVRSLTEALASHGYWTAESVANSGFLTQWTGLTRGFLISETGRPVDLSNGAHRFYLRAGARQFFGVRAVGFDQPFRVASDITVRAQAILEQAHHNGRPFFLFLNYMDAHWPYAPEAPDLNDVSPRVQATQDFVNQVNQGSATLSARQRDLLLEEYDEGIASIDASIGRVMERLRSLGLYDDSLIVVTSDHGEGFLEHGFMEHEAGVLYQENLHVPLVIKYPGQHEAHRSDLLASEVDIVPTILETAGIRVPQELQGRSLSHAVPADSDTVFADASPLAPLKMRSSKMRGSRQVVLSGSLKLIAWSAGLPEMYDLSVDPEEKCNLYSARDPRAIALSGRLERWAAAMPSLEHGSKQLDERVIERLKSLGYTQ
jgi:arylsulfatase A-like enzyme